MTTDTILTACRARVPGWEERRQYMTQYWTPTGDICPPYVIADILEDEGRTREAGQVRAITSPAVGVVYICLFSGQFCAPKW